MIVVHHLNNSRSQRVLWLLEELGVPYEVHKVDLMKGEHMGPRLSEPLEELGDKRAVLLALALRGLPPERGEWGEAGRVLEEVDRPVRVQEVGAAGVLVGVACVWIARVAWSRSSQNAPSSWNRWYYVVAFLSLFGGLASIPSQVKKRGDLRSARFDGVGLPVWR